MEKIQKCGGTTGPIIGSRCAMTAIRRSSVFLGSGSGLVDEGADANTLDKLILDKENISECLLPLFRDC